MDELAFGGHPDEERLAHLGAGDVADDVAHRPAGLLMDPIEVGLGQRVQDLERFLALPQQRSQEVPGSHSLPVD